MHWRHRAWFNACGNHNGLRRRQAGRLVVKDAGAAPALWQVRARQGQEREQTCPRTQRLVITQSPRPAQIQLCHSLSIEAWRFWSFQHPEKHKISSWSMNIVCLAENVIVNKFDLGHNDNGWGYYWLEKLDNVIQQCTVAKLAQTEPNVASFAHRIGTNWPKKGTKSQELFKQVYVTQHGPQCWVTQSLQRGVSWRRGRGCLERPKANIGTPVETWGL